MQVLRLLKRDVELVRSRVRHSGSHERILFVLVVAYIVYFALASFLRYDNFYTGRFDLGNMVQAVWNTSQGRLFAVTDTQGIGETTRLAFHADFFLIFLAPFYMLWPSPKLLLLVQTVVLALGAVFVYKLGLHILRNKGVSISFAVAYLLNPSVQRSNLYDFHAVVLATTFLLGAFYFMKTRRYWWFLFFAFLAGSTKEQVWAIVGLMGLFIVGRSLYTMRAARSRFTSYLKKELVLGSIVAIVSLTTFYMLFSVVIPGIRGEQHFAAEYFSDFGDSPSGIVKGVLTSPGKVFETTTDPTRIQYLRKLFLPIGYFSILSPLYLIFALPDLLINLLSKNDNFHQIYYQYTATITPFLFIAAMFGVRLLRYFLPRIPFPLVTVYVVVMALYGSYLYGPLPYAVERNIDMFTKPRSNKDAIEKYLESIPDDASVTASNQLGSHLSERKFIYTLPDGMNAATYVLFLLNDQTTQPTLQARDLADRMRYDPSYILLFQDGDFVVFKRNKLSYLLY
ncbi:MAG: DUF2079 domain-containing protein [Candidatus Levybacteria bacterium]|nr:DUF2079 domain-containing protein [Candidatus Levybacteria bacterium]